MSPLKQMQVKTLWSNPELLQEAQAIFGLPCELDGKTGGCATWTEGPLHKVEIRDGKGAKLQVQGHGSKTILSFMPVMTQQSPKILTVESESATEALAAMAIAVAVDAGLFTSDEALNGRLFEKWSQAAETKSGAKKILEILEYALLPGDKSWEDFQAFIAK